MEERDLTGGCGDDEEVLRNREGHGGAQEARQNQYVRSPNGWWMRKWEERRQRAPPQDSRIPRFQDSGAGNPGAVES